MEVYHMIPRREQIRAAVFLLLYTVLALGAETWVDLLAAAL